ncbi:hypothetical protein HUA74_08560 [Myxococcus sp. CA051A]|uniref:hypothetical protein n=1 Tax=unclassified Myxococcus TaxID=2648731 RepID=UPI00157A71EA|nr:MULTISPECIES: hypothetical protein [unclassified Myxococcus]NTX56663.1 hypothetical protein [Myxococcus sp. CA039A]NTX60709.1 hypothetical protein [Myxococcus sp. CA051A]
MRYGDDKSFEMARSLLPSTHRQAARKSRASLHRRSRRSSRTRVAQLIRDPEFAEDCAELDEDTSSEMRGLVWERQASDKVNPFIRWAEQRTLDQPRDLRLGLMRKALPDGLVGRHALSHLKQEKHFLSTAELSAQESWRLRTRKKSLPTERGLMAQLLRELLRLPTGQKALNSYLKRASATGWSRQWGHDGHRHVVLHGSHAPRLLLGVHDVLPFLDDLGFESRLVSYWSRPPRPEAPTRPLALKFLRTFHRLKGDLTATLAALPVPVLTNQPR